MKKYINPDGLFNPGIYTHVVETSGGRTIYLAGQVAWDLEGNVVGTTLREQAIQAFENLKLALESVGGTLDDVVKMTMYIANYDPAERVGLIDVYQHYLGTEHPPANTLIGVQSLARPDLLIELDAFAIIEDEA